MYFMMVINLSDSISKVTNCISTRISSEKIKEFDTGIELTVSNLANGGVNLKFNNSVFMQKSFSSLCSNFISKLYIVYELNSWSRNPANNYLKNNFLKNYLFGTVKLVRNNKK